MVAQDLSAGTSPALGLDAGGTATRWALADAAGAIVAEGEVDAISGVQLLGAEGRAALDRTLAALAQALRTASPRPSALRAACAGVTGLDASMAPALEALLARAFGIEPRCVRAMGDIELLCHSAGAPGTCLVLYAGTGAVAAALEADGTLQRAGGRGAVIDDAGGGHWIAREALRVVWRREDEAPGSGSGSPLGRALAARIGGGDWAATRAFVYGPGAARGTLGRLALAVAEAAPDDAAARDILQRAGVELARLVRALAGRTGPRPLVLAGRAFDLDPAIEAALAAAMQRDGPQHLPRRRLEIAPHHAAARLAHSPGARSPA